MEAHWFAAAFALLLLWVLLSIWLGRLGIRGRRDRARRTISRGLRLSHGSRHVDYATISHLRAQHPSELIEGRWSAKDDDDRRDRSWPLWLYGNQDRREALAV